MTARRVGHLADDGAPCNEHPAADPDALLHFAAIGARTSGFNHDLASKIQGLMMSHEELAEMLGAAPAEIARALDTAQTVVRELNQLLAQHRALTRPPARRGHALADVVARAAERVRVEVGAPIPDREVEVSAPHAIQAVAFALDVAAGDGDRRTVAVTTTDDAGAVELAIGCGAARTGVGEALALAAWLLARDGGALRCRPGAIVLRLPVPGSDAS